MGVLQLDSEVWGGMVFFSFGGQEVLGGGLARLESLEADADSLQPGRRPLQAPSTLLKIVQSASDWSLSSVADNVQALSAHDGAFAPDHQAGQRWLLQGKPIGSDGILRKKWLLRGRLEESPHLCCP